jgi:hypothetical protein
VSRPMSGCVEPMQPLSKSASGRMSNAAFITTPHDLHPRDLQFDAALLAEIWAPGITPPVDGGNGVAAP